MISIRALDVDVELEVDDARLGSELRTALRMLRRTDGAPSAAHQERIAVTRLADDVWVLRSETQEVQLSTAGQTLARTLEFINLAAARSIVDVIPIHAAAVADEHGNIIVLAGRSGAGKSTLGAASTMRGWRLVAEEIAATDPLTGSVRAYPRPVGLRAGGAAALGVPVPVTEDDLFSEVYPWVPPSNHVADFGEVVGIALVGRSEAEGVDDVRPALALEQLAEHMVVPVDERVPSAFRQLETLVRRLPVVRLTYLDPFDGTQLIDELVKRWT